MPVFTDQTGRTVVVPDKPARIVSLVPSQTELLYHLGLKEAVAGITKFCVHPAHWFNSKTRVGGTKTIHLSRIHELQPDLIIANKEENTQAQIDVLSRRYPVWISDIGNLQEALNMVMEVGAITGTAATASTIAGDIQSRFAQLQFPATPRRTAYLIWQDPYMTVGGDTFIHDLLQRCGFENIFASRQRYPVVTLQEIQALQCELLLLSSEPFPFKQQHVDALQQLLPDAKIALVNGELFSWYGSRLLEAPAYFTVLQKDLMKDGEIC